MILYFLKTIALLGIFYTLYTLFLKDKKSFRWNRMFLVFTSLITIVIPFLNALTFGQNAETIGQSKALSVTLDTVNVYANAIKSTELDFGKIILGIYAVGLLWGVLRVILGFIVIRRIKLTSVVEKRDGQQVYFSEHIESPFSFGKNIFIPQNFKNKPVLQTILQHESAHITLMHSRDKILFSLLQAIFWFNPFVYLYHKELELIHEFEADEIVTKEITTDDYVQNLLQTITYSQTPTLLVHQFFHHPIKTRITMLYKRTKNARMQKIIVTSTTLLICLFTLFMQGYAQKKSSGNKNGYTIIPPRTDSVIVEMPDGTLSLKLVKSPADTVYELADVMPEFTGGQDGLYRFISENLKYPELEAKNKIEGKVVVNFIVDRNGFINDVKAVKTPENGSNLAIEAVRVVSKMPRWQPGMQAGRPASVSFTLPISFQLKK